MRRPPPFAAVCCLVALIGCAEEKPAPREVVVAFDAAVAAEVPSLTAFELGGVTEAQALEGIGALPAWSAVVERSRLLERRGQSGAVWGRVGAASGNGRWLVDETEGGGRLAIRVRFPSKLPIREGMRVTVWGAWSAGAGESWLFGATRVQTLEGREPESALAPPGLVLGQGRPRGRDVPISEASEPGEFVFMVVRAPLNARDGWLIADRSTDEAVARLYLPGEREPYGGQDLRSRSERWSLERGVRFRGQISEIRQPRVAGSLPIMRTESAPVEIARARRR